MNTMIPTTVIPVSAPQYFGAPAFGTTSLTPACSRVRDLDGIALTAAHVSDDRAVKADFWGNPAWSPPL